MFFLKNHIVKLFGTFELLNFEFVSDFGFRISDFLRLKAAGIVQNEPNLRNAKMNTTTFNKNTYDKLYINDHHKNEPNLQSFLFGILYFGNSNLFRISCLEFRISCG